MPEQACYRNLTGYKYELVKDYTLEITIKPPTDIVEPAEPAKPYIALTAGGTLTVKDDYAWDGPSGPVPDTKSVMRASLVHDALYQLMRTSRLGLEHREAADMIYRDICIQDGTSKVWAAIMYRGLRMFGESHAKPQPEPEYKVTCVP